MDLLRIYEARAGLSAVPFSRSWPYGYIKPADALPFPDGSITRQLWSGLPTGREGSRRIRRSNCHVYLCVPPYIVLVFNADRKRNHYYSRNAFFSTTGRKIFRNAKQSECCTDRPGCWTISADKEYLRDITTRNTHICILQIKGKCSAAHSSSMHCDGFLHNRSLTLANTQLCALG